MTDDEIMTALGAPGVSPEGRFHPDTYAYSKGATDLAVLKRAYRAMQTRLDAAWRERAPDSPLRSADEALILASIVEKRNRRRRGPRRVAGVFANRLKLGMPLQTDPTIIYGLARTSTATCTSATCSPIRPTTPTPAPACPRRRFRCRARPRCSRRFTLTRPRPSTSSRARWQQRIQRHSGDHNRAVNQYQRKK